MNAPPRHPSLCFDASGNPKGIDGAHPKDALFHLESCVDPIFLGIVPGHTQFRLKAKHGKYLRMHKDKKADFEGGDGPLPWMTLVAHPSVPRAFVFRSVETGHHLRCLPDGSGFDGGAPVDGPNAALHFYVLSKSECCRLEH